ncbi:MAG TPA: hypothetical protein V6D05_10010, partial [Stenomitos sp.]
MRTRLLPALTYGMLAATVGCSQSPPTSTLSQPPAPDAQRQVQADEPQAVDESKLPKPMSIQDLPQKLDPSQVVTLPEDKIKVMDLDVSDGQGDRTVQQRGRGFGRSFGGRGFSRFGTGRRFFGTGRRFFGTGRRYYYSYPYYYPYYYYNN